MRVKAENVSIDFGPWKMENVSIEIPEGSFTSIVGPSGSGKTTLMRAICGLQTIDSGRILFGGEDYTMVPAERRNVGVVFQGDSLFSHMDVFENVAFGLRMKNADNIPEKVSAALSVVELGGLEKRSINKLSGGEKKRVAIARALAFEPAILLLDEPLNGLDARLKERMKVFLKSLREKTGITMVLVTHDLDEAFFLSDSMVVMNNGRVEQAGSPIKIFSEPGSEFVKGFVSDYVLVEGKEKTVRGRRFVEGKFMVPSKKGKGQPFMNFKKTNYRFF